MCVKTVFSFVVGAGYKCRYVHTPCEVRLFSRAEGSKFGRVGRAGRVVDEGDRGGKGRGCCCCRFDRVSAMCVRSELHVCQ